MLIQYDYPFVQEQLCSIPLIQKLRNSKLFAQMYLV